MLSVFASPAPPPCPASFNMAAHVLARGATLPDKIALAVIGPSRSEQWSYARLIEAVRGTGTGLLQSGLKPGDRILIRLGNTVDFPITYLAAIGVGLVPVPTSPQLTAPETATLIDLVRPAAIVLGDGIACPETPLPVVDETCLRAMRTLPPAEWQMGDPDRPGYVVFTSGTSGVPRAVVHAHRAIWARRMMHDGWYGLRESDRLLHAGAFNWTYTMGTGLMDPWSLGATALIPAQGVDPAQIPLLLQRHDATIFAAAPGVYRKFLTQDRLDLPDLRHGLSAGEKLSDRIKAAWEAATGTPVFEAYGMSECSTFISAAPARPAASGTIGRPQVGRHVAILGLDGTPTPLGHPGTIAVHRRDPGLMLGYHDAPEATAARFHGDWFLTGDQGTMDADGQIVFHGRSDDMMNAGGYRVSPIEVENALLDHPGITACAVTEIRVKADVAVIMAFYTGPAALNAAQLEHHCATRLARYKCPRAFHHVAALPMGANNKIIRRALVSVHEAIHGQA